MLDDPDILESPQEQAQEQPNQEIASPTEVERMFDQAGECWKKYHFQTCQMNVREGSNGSSCQERQGSQ